MQGKATQVLYLFIEGPTSLAQMSNSCNAINRRPRMFFPFSASQYSQGLSLLIPSCKNEEKQMRVSPWNQYQLVKQEISPQLQLASKKGQVFCRCTPFIFFRRASAGGNETFPPKVDLVCNSETSSDSSSNGAKNSTASDAVDQGEKKIHLKSSLKNPHTDCSGLVAGAVEKNDTSSDLQSLAPGFTKRRKVQWTDSCGKELVEVKEFISRYNAMHFFFSIQ